MDKDFRKDILPWWKIMERQIAEDIIIRECTDKNKPVPEGRSMERRVDKMISDWYKEVD